MIPLFVEAKKIKIKIHLEHGDDI